MNSERIAAVVPALQLLLADAAPSVQRQAFITAFPGNYLILRGEADILHLKLAEIRALAKDLVGICDGSSALGVIAAKNAGFIADRIHTNVRVLSGMVGLVR